MKDRLSRISVGAALDRIYFPVMSILAAFLISSVIFVVLGFNPLVAFQGLLDGSVGSLKAWGDTLNKATPVILTGLSYAIAQRCGIVNLGAEGQVYIGALCGALVGTEVSLPAPFHGIVTLAAAFLGGALFGMLPAIMKNRFGASELITTIMFNYVALYFVHYLISGPIKDLSATSNMAQSKQMLETAQLPRLLAAPNRLHAGILIAILALVFYQFFLFHTKRGFEMRVIGLNRTAGECAGMNTKSNTLLSMFIAGGFAGLAGACELMGVLSRIQLNCFNNIGFDGIAVALLGGNTAFGILLSGILFGGLKSGANKMMMKSGAPTAVIYMLQGLIILFVIGKKLFDYHKLQKNKKHSGKGAA